MKECLPDLGKLCASWPPHFLNPVVTHQLENYRLPNPENAPRKLSPEVLKAPPTSPIIPLPTCNWWSTPSHHRAPFWSIFLLLDASVKSKFMLLHPLFSCFIHIGSICIYMYIYVYIYTHMYMYVSNVDYIILHIRQYTTNIYIYTHIYTCTLSTIRLHHHSMAPPWPRRHGATSRPTRRRFPRRKRRGPGGVGRSAAGGEEFAGGASDGGWWGLISGVNGGKLGNPPTKCDTNGC